MQLRRALIVLGILGLAVLAVNSLGQFGKITTAFTHVRWYVVPLVIVVQLLSYLCSARYYQAFFATTERHIPLRRLYEAAIGIDSVNQAIPSGGVSGTTYLAQSLRRYTVPTAQSTLSQLAHYGFTFLSFFALLAFGFLALLFAGDLNKTSVRLALFLMLVVLMVSLTLLLIFSEHRRLKALLLLPIRIVNTFAQRVLGRHKPLIQPAALSHFLHELYQGYHELVAHKRHWPALFGWTFGGSVAEVLTVYAVFLGFGQIVNPGIVITGYALAIVAGTVSILTNGIGIYEASMVGTFTALGVPLALSLAVVFVYRILNLGIFLPVGLHFYRKHLQESSP